MSAAPFHLGVLMPPSPVRRPDSTEQSAGSNAASVECIRAIVRRIGDRRVTLFVQDAKVTEYKDAIQDVAPLDLSSIFVSPLSDMSVRLSTDPLDALFVTEGPFLDSAGSARQQFSRTVFPVSCAQYGGISHQPFLRDYAFRVLLARTLPCDSIICASQAAKRATERILSRLAEILEESYGFSNCTGMQLPVIPHGVATDQYRPRDQQDARAQLGLPLHKTIVLHFGRIDPCSKSDVIPLLLALQRARTGNANILLLLVGWVADVYRKQLDSAITELGLRGRVLIRTDVPRVSNALYYAAADIFVSLSDILPENFGLTPVEAMACGVPVVVSDWAGYKETVIHGETGFRVPTTWAECDDELCMMAPFYDWTVDHFYLAQSVAIDVELAAKYIDQLVSNPELRKEMGERAARHVRENFSWERSAGMLWDHWQESAEMARHIDRSAIPGPCLIRPHYYEDFHDFATASLTPTSRFELTERGRRAASGKAPLLLLEEPRGLIRADVARTMLRFLRFHAVARIAPSLESLERSVARGGRLTPHALRRHLCWLLKYDLIRVAAK